MERKLLKLEWTEKHADFVEVDSIGGKIVGSQMTNAFMDLTNRTSVFHRQNVIPESIKFSIEDNS